MEPMGTGQEEKIRGVENALVPRTALLSDVPERRSLKARMDNYGVPGVGLAVITDYRLDWARGYGIREIGRTGSVDENTLFQAGSISKPLAAAAALRLVEKGMLDLDEDVNTFLVSWKVPSNGPWAPRVTLRHLLNHTGGLTVETYAGYARGQEVPDLLQVLNGAKPANSMPVRVNTIPGTQFRYSSGGYAILQQLLMDVVELPFPELMNELVLRPLEMHHSTFGQPLPEALHPLAAAGYRKAGQMIPGKWFIYPEMATGGLWSTPSDLARFVIELQKAVDGLSDGILSRAMTREMLSGPGDMPVGLGIFLEREGALPVFSHVGNNEGFYAKMVGHHRSGLGAVVMTNWHYSFLADELVMAVASEYRWPGHIRHARSPVQIDAKILSSCVGDYELSSKHVLVITRKQDSLYLCPPEQMEMELHPMSETEFLAKVVNAEVVFQRTSEGGVDGLLLRQQGRELQAKKIG